MSSSTPEYLGAAAPDPTDDGSGPRRGRRTALVAGAVVAVTAAIGVGAYGVAQLMSGGAAPATAVPADALGYVSLDLDPSASQKIEAISMLRKFPALKKQMHISSRDDLRRAVFDQIVKSGDCQGVDYAKDVQPWIGERVAVAAVPDPKEVAAPLLVLQVGDQEQARAGFAKLERCGSGKDPRAGLAFVGDYLLVAETQKKADAMAADAQSSALADDADYQKWMGRAGDPGILTMYAAPEAAAALVDAEGRVAGEGSPLGDQGRAKSLATGFQGAAGVVRFSGGAVEVEMTTAGLPHGVGAVPGSGPDVTTLPGSTAVALSLAFRDGWMDDLLSRVRSGGGGDSLEKMFAQGERATGLRLPADLEKVLGSGVTVSVDGSADVGALATAPDPTTVPAGVRITGDPATITPVLDRLKRAAGPGADPVLVRSGDGVVAVGADRDYLDTLLAKGDLGSVQAFRDVVPRADRATGMLYVNFDANGWADKLAGQLSDGDPQVRANVAPLEALGLSGWLDGDQVQHGLLRLTAD